MSSAPYPRDHAVSVLPFFVSREARRESMKPAAFWRRGLAWCIDCLVQLLLLALASVTGFAIGLGGALLNIKPETLQFAAGLSTVFLMVIGSWLYAAYMESSERQATYGKMLARIVVTDMAGRRISFGRATARHFAKYLSAFAIMVGYLVALFSKNNQAMHDMAAETLVVRAPN